MILIQGGVTPCRRRRRRAESCARSTEATTIAEMTASVTHELNNRLSVILGQTQLLRRAATVDPVAAGKLEKIEHEVLRASAMTRGLLDRSRLEPRREPVAINSLAVRALERVRPMLGTRGIGLHVDFSEPAPVILGDSDQLLHVLHHLIDNALAAMAEGGTLTVTTALDDDKVEVTVADTGTGMDPEHAARIFEPFYTTKQNQRGAGLGLFLTLTTLKAHGGTITVETAPGRGTTMRMRLPRGSAGGPRLIVIK